MWFLRYFFCGLMILCGMYYAGLSWLGVVENELFVFSASQSLEATQDEFDALSAEFQLRSEFKLVADIAKVKHERALRPLQNELSSLTRDFRQRDIQQAKANARARQLQSTFAELRDAVMQEATPELVDEFIALIQSSGFPKNTHDAVQARGWLETIAVDCPPDVLDRFVAIAAESHRPGNTLDPKGISDNQLAGEIISRLASERHSDLLRQMDLHRFSSSTHAPALQSLLKVGDDSLIETLITENRLQEIPDAAQIMVERYGDQLEFMWVKHLLASQYPENFSPLITQCGLDLTRVTLKSLDSHFYADPDQKVMGIQPTRVVDAMLRVGVNQASVKEARSLFSKLAKSNGLHIRLIPLLQQWGDQATLAFIPNTSRNAMLIKELSTHIDSPSSDQALITAYLRDPLSVEFGALEKRQTFVASCLDKLHTVSPDHSVTLVQLLQKLGTPTATIVDQAAKDLLKRDQQIIKAAVATISRMKLDDLSHSKVRVSVDVIRADSKRAASMPAAYDRMIQGLLASSDPQQIAEQIRSTRYQTASLEAFFALDMSTPQWQQAFLDLLRDETAAFRHYLPHIAASRIPRPLEQQLLNALDEELAEKVHAEIIDTLGHGGAQLSLHGLTKRNKEATSPYLNAAIIRLKQRIPLRRALVTDAKELLK